MFNILNIYCIEEIYSYLTSVCDQFAFMLAFNYKTDSFLPTNRLYIHCGSGSLDVLNFSMLDGEIFDNTSIVKSDITRITERFDEYTTSIQYTYRELSINILYMETNYTLCLVSDDWFYNYGYYTVFVLNTLKKLYRVELYLFNIKLNEILENHTIQDLVIHNYNTNQNDMAFVSTFKNVKKLTLKGHLIKNFLKGLQRLKHIKYLDIQEYQHRNSDLNFKKLLEICPDLEYLAFSIEYVGSDIKKLTALKFLNSLAILNMRTRDNLKVLELLIEMIAKKFHKLSTLKISFGNYFDQIDNEILKRINMLTHLEHLYLEQDRKFKELRCLRAYSCVLNNLKNLKTLTIKTRSKYTFEIYTRLEYNQKTETLAIATNNATNGECSSQNNDKNSLDIQKCPNNDAMNNPKMGDCFVKNNFQNVKMVFIKCKNLGMCQRFVQWIFSHGKLCNNGIPNIQIQCENTKDRELLKQNLIELTHHEELVILDTLYSIQKMDTSYITEE